MFAGFAHSQLTSMLQLRSGIRPVTLTSGQSAHTYDVSPQLAAGIDSWSGGGTLFKNLLFDIMVSQATAGTLAIYLYDSLNPITTANGAGTPYLAATLANISAIGHYYAELQFVHVFGDATDGVTPLARVVADADNMNIRRYHSIT